MQPKTKTSKPHTFQLTAARRRLARFLFFDPFSQVLFQLTAARRRLEFGCNRFNPLTEFQLTAARRRLASIIYKILTIICFNSQPPEGGWLAVIFILT